MKPLLLLHTRAFRLALAVALCLGASLAAAAEKKPEEKKAPEKQPAGPKQAAGDPKAGVKEAPATVTNTLPITVVFPKSTFSIALETGRDPFFPSSKRRVPKAPEPPKIKPPPVTPTPPLVIPPVVINTNPPPANTNTTPVVVVPPPDLIGSANLTLRGLSGTKARRVAVVHSGTRSYDFQKGESALIRLPNDKQLKVRCVDIRERSAVFEAEGEIKELFLREGVF